MIATETVYIKNLNQGDLFVMPGLLTLYICEDARTEGGLTSVTYRVAGSVERYTFVKPSFSTAYLSN